MSNEVLSVELEIKDDKAEVVISRTKQKLEDFVRTAEKSQPTIKVKIDNPLTGKLTTDFDALSKRVEETRLKFSEVAKARLDNGQIGSLTREILTAQTHSRQLAADIAIIKKEIANPNRTSSITLLTANLRAAEEEADRLSRKLNSLPGGASGSGLNSKGAANNLKLSSFQKQNLSYQINDVVTMAAMGANPTQILASQGGQIAQIFNPAQITAFTAAYGGLVSILGAGTLAIAATYKITGDMRERAEKYLAVQTKITAELNKQRLALKESDREFAEQRANAARSDNFSRALAADNSMESLTLRKQRIEESLERLKVQRTAVLNTFGKDSPENSKVNNDIAQTQSELLEAEKRLRDLPVEKNAQSLKSFEQRNEEFKKSQQNAAEYEKKRAEEAAKAEKKRLEDVEKAKEKVKELQRQYLMTFDQLARRAGENNPFVSIFLDADKALKDLKENIKGLPPALQKAAIEMQQKFNLKQLFDAQINNALSVFSLRNDAKNFRNPFDPDKQKKDQDEFVADFLRKNPNYLYLENKSALDEDARKKILDRFAPASLTKSPLTNLNNDLTDKLNLLYKPGQTAEQIASSDKAFIAATSGVNPLDLNRDNRVAAAMVREREAARQEQYQKDVLTYMKDQTDYQKTIAENSANQNKMAEKGGTKALEVIFKDKTSDGNVELQKSATSADTNAAYQDDTSFFSMLNPSAFKK